MCKDDWWRMPGHIRDKVNRAWRAVFRDRETYEAARDEAIAWQIQNPPRQRTML